jgi:hypothetical protein
MLSDNTVDRGCRSDGRAELWDRADRLAVPVSAPTLWCVYYSGAHTDLALQALDGTIQFAGRDPQLDPKRGDLVFAAAGGGQVRVKRHTWPGEEPIAVVIFGLVASVTKNRLILDSPVVWGNVPGHLLNPTVADRLHYSAVGTDVRRPVLCAAVGLPEPPVLRP